MTIQVLQKKIALCIAFISISSCSLLGINFRLTPHKQIITSAQAESKFINKHKSVEPNSKSFLRQFENDIVQKILDNYFASFPTIVTSRIELQKNNDRARIAIKQLLALDETLLSSMNLRKIRQLVVYTDFTEYKLKHWGETNHLNSLQYLLPNEHFSTVSTTSLKLTKEHVLNIPAVLKRLEILVADQISQQAKPYPKSAIDTALNICTQLSAPEANPFVIQYQSLLTYSSLDPKEQKSKLASFNLEYSERVEPALLQFVSFLESLNSHLSESTDTIKFSSTLTVSATSALPLIEEKLIENQTSIIKLLSKLKGSPNSLRAVYENPEYKNDQFRLLKQRTLDLLSQYTSDVYVDLKNWFLVTPAQPLFVAENNSVRTTPFYYENGVAYFDLKLLFDVPAFELEALSYLYTVPGQHIVDGDANLEPFSEIDRTPVTTAFSKGFALYSLNLPRAPLYYNHPLSKLGKLSQQRLALLLAKIDIQLMGREWSLEDAMRYLSVESPYSKTLTKRYIQQVSSAPGVAVETILIANALEKLSRQAKIDIGLTQVQFHQVILDRSPLTSDTLKKDMFRLLTESKK